MASLFGAIEHGVRRHASKLLHRSAKPEAGEVFLNQRRVYIVPTHPGLFYCVVLAALFIASLNYNLSLGFGFTFLIAGCALIGMHLTFRNLAHLHLTAGKASTVFAGEEASFELHLHNRRRHARYAIYLDFVGDGIVSAAYPSDIPANGNTAVRLSTPTRKRGWLQAPRVRLQTRFPLGLFRAWSYWQPDAHALVYPHPEDDAPPLPLSGSDSGEAGGSGGVEEFAGIRGYQPGDSPKRLAWRQIARVDLDYGGALVTKAFEGGSQVDVDIDFSQLPAGMPLEDRLSRMTRWVVEAELRGIPYGFRLGSVRFERALGPMHQQACLQALALYQGTP